MNGLPKGWEKEDIRSLYDVNPGHRGIEINDETEVSFIPMTLIEEKTGSLQANLIRKYQDVKSGYTKFIEGDVVFAKITPCMENGKIAIANNLKNGLGCGTTELHVFRPLVKGTDRYLLYFLLQDSIREEARKCFQGTSGHLRVPASFFDGLKFPIPPFNEQCRIVARLEELLGKVDACKKRLERIPAILKRFRQSVLAAACSGRLTADWREQKQTETPIGGLEDAPEGFNPLPDTWYWKPLEAVCGQIVDCPHSTPKWTEKGRICVRTTNFKPGVLDLQNIQYVSDETFTKRIERLKPQPGDIIYSREGGILGIACMIPPETAICLGQRMMLFRAKTDYQAVLLMHWLNSPLVLNRVRELTGGSAAPHLNVRDIKNFPTPCPPPDEQHEIVSRVDALFNIAGQIEERYTQAKSHVDKLTQSILAKAFRGELVPQSPNDEPASVLLERIHADLKAASRLSTKPQRTKASQQKKRNRESIRHGATV